MVTQYERTLRQNRWELRAFYGQYIDCRISGCKGKSFITPSSTDMVCGKHMWEDAKYSQV